MAIDFPGSPTNGQTFTSGSVTYTWDGTKWTATASGGGGGATDKIEEGNTSAEVIDTGSDGRFVVTTEGTERARVDSLGVVRIGGANTYNGSDKLTLVNNSGNCSLTISSTSTGESSIFLADGVTGNEAYRGYLQYKHSSDALHIGTAGTERMRISNNGTLSVHGNADSPSVNFSVTHGPGTHQSFAIYSGGSSTTSLGTKQFFVQNNGDVRNTNNSYGQITSDERFKQDIVDANSQWDDIKNIRITNYRWKSDPTGPMLLGPIAQELQAVSPGLVDTRIAVKEDETASGGLVSEGDEVLSFKGSILYMKAVKALQEAMERIETLEAKVAALENPTVQP